MLKKLSILLLALVSLPALADSSHAYANAVLEALQKKGLLSEHDVADIKQHAQQADLQASKLSVAKKPSVNSAVNNLVVATKKNVNKASPNIKFLGVSAATLHLCPL